MNFDCDNVCFSFPESWIVSKYDEWAFYKKQFQKILNGQKAVDLLALNQKTLWLIELKDYRHFPRTKLMDLDKEIALKIRDTLSGLLSASFNANLLEEKNMACQFKNAEKIRIGLQIEQPKTNSKLFPRFFDIANLKLKLKSLLKAIDPHILVVDSQKNQDKAGWKIL